MKCPKCQSENTQRLQVAYESGTSNIDTHSKTVGGGLGGTSLGGGAAYTNTTGVSQTRMAERASPPEKKGTAIAVGAAIVFSLPAYLFLSNGSFMWGILFLSLIAGAVWLAKEWIKYNSNVWPGLYDSWKKSWVCHKCGNIYQYDF
jgi:hypothetical protein